MIYLGGARIFQARHTGEDVGYGTLSEFFDEIATVRPPRLISSHGVLIELLRSVVDRR